MKLVFVICTLFSSMAFARLDVTCLPGGCLIEGWEVFDERNGNLVEVLCHDDNCVTSGWDMRVGGFSSTAECHEEGCFTDGWTSYDNFNGRVLDRVTCGDDKDGVIDCLVSGWRLQRPGQAPIRVICKNNDCRKNGWKIHFPGGTFQVVRCKDGGCFNSGWYLYP